MKASAVIRNDAGVGHTARRRSGGNDLLRLRPEDHSALDRLHGEVERDAEAGERGEDGEDAGDVEGDV